VCFLLLQLTREEISGPEFPVNRQDFSEVSKAFFELAIRRFESCQVSQPVWSLPKAFRYSELMPANSGLPGARVVSRDYIIEQTFPILPRKSLRNHWEIPVFRSREAETKLDDTASCVGSDILTQLSSRADTSAMSQDAMRTAKLRGQYSKMSIRRRVQQLFIRHQPALRQRRLRWMHEPPRLVPLRVAPESLP